MADVSLDGDEAAICAHRSTASAWCVQAALRVITTGVMLALLADIVTEHGSPFGEMLRDCAVMGDQACASR